MVVGDHIIPGYIILALAVLVFFGLRSIPPVKGGRFLRFCIGTIRYGINTVCVLFAIYGLDKTFSPTEAVNIRVTVTVDDNGREVQGSSVWRVVSTGNGRDSSRSYGNAVIVDLAEKGKLFALLISANDEHHRPQELVQDFFWIHFDSQDKGRNPSDPDQYVQINSLGEKGIIEYRPGDEDLHKTERSRGHQPRAKKRPDGSTASYAYPPKLVLFKDIKDHSTLRQTDGRFLHVEFGPGVRLKSITAEPTLDPRTDNGIENIVPIPSPRGKPPEGWNQRHWELFANNFQGY